MTVIANITLVVASSLPCQLMATSAYAKKWEMGNVKLMMSGNAIGNGIAQPKNVSKNAQHAEDAKNAKIAAALVLRTLNYSHVDSRAHESSEKEVEKEQERKWSGYADDGEEKHARADESFSLRLLALGKYLYFTEL